MRLAIVSPNPSICLIAARLTANRRWDLVNRKTFGGRELLRD